MAPPRSLTQAPVLHSRKGGFVSRKERKGKRQGFVAGRDVKNKNTAGWMPSSQTDRSQRCSSAGKWCALQKIHLATYTA